MEFVSAIGDHPGRFDMVSNGHLLDEKKFMHLELSGNGVRHDKAHAKGLNDDTSTGILPTMLTFSNLQTA